MQSSNIMRQTQLSTASFIQLMLAKYYFANLISGKESDYLRLLRGKGSSNQELPEKCKLLGNELLIFNRNNQVFNNKLFERNILSLIR